MRDKAARLVEFFGSLLLILTAIYIVSISALGRFIINPMIIPLMISLFIIGCIGSIYLGISIKNKKA